MKKRLFKENVESYDYKEAVKSDIIDYLDKNYNKKEYNEETYVIIKDLLYDELFDYDNVTCNGSGSYTYDAEKAKNYFLGDPKSKIYLEKAVDTFNISASTLADHLFDYEWMDVVIRCNLLNKCIDEAVDEWWDKDEEIEECNNGKKQIRFGESFRRKEQKRKRYTAKKMLKEDNEIENDEGYYTRIDGFEIYYPFFAASWDVAEKEAKRLKVANHSKWRLPTVDEAKRILKKLRYEISITSESFWTSEEELNGKAAYVVNKYGDVLFKNKNLPFDVFYIR